MSDDAAINLLLVDDRPENLLALTAIIERDDYHLVTAASGEEALLLIMKYEFAVILMDVQMPGIDGFETARIIKAREKTRNIPIIFITANNMESTHIYTGYSVGAIDYIVKPFDPYILQAKVENFVAMYRLGRRIQQQSHALAEQKASIEQAYADLSEASARLQESEALANVISETSLDAMLVVDPGGSILKANPAAARLFCYRESELLGSSVLTLLAGDSDQHYIRSRLGAHPVLDQAGGSDRPDEIEAMRKDGTTFPAEIQVGKRYVQDKSLIALTIRDITQKRQDEATITRMAYHDGLTDLPNRRYFYELAAKAIAESMRSNKQLALLYLDLDRFKYVNDSLGHSIGDSLLQHIAVRLTDALREQDVLARVGGDEFNVLLPDSNREAAIDTAERLIEAMREPYYVDRYELHLTVSVGISMFPYDGEDPALLMKHADAALYRAKEQGKNQYNIYHSGMDMRTYRSFVLQNDLRKAIERGELTLHYQPLIEPESGIVRTIEALVRWNHPTWGMLLPDEFIPIAEETGQMIEIGEWVLRTACQQGVKWQHAGYALVHLAVNFSSQQFMQRDLVDRVAAILTETGFDPQLLEIEVTESTLMGDEARMIQLLNRIRRMGIKVSLDDFGSANSSLHFMRTFPIDTLKIDQTFFQSVGGRSEESEALLAAVIALANRMDMTIAAERVESEEQWQLLRRVGCRVAQGRLFCPPVPEEVVMRCLHAWDEPQPIAAQAAAEPYKEEALPVLTTGREYLESALQHVKQEHALSAREFEVFRLMAEGVNNKGISERLYISEHTVKNHITRIFQKLNVTDRLQALSMIYQLSLEASKRSSPSL